jgi:hypothetical protein
MIQIGFSDLACTCGQHFEDGQAQKAVDHVIDQHMRPKDRKSDEYVKARVRVMIYPDPLIEGGTIPDVTASAK